jgi:hypothetical protein
VSNVAGILHRLLRVSKGQPKYLGSSGVRSVGVAPLTHDQFEQVRRACATQGGGAWRAFSAAFGAGAGGGVAVGARFVVRDERLQLALTDGQLRPVLLTVVADGPVVEGTEVLDGDWDAMRSIASGLLVRVDLWTAMQTFRRDVLGTGIPLQVLIREYALTEDQINAILPYLGSVDVATSKDVGAMLRGAPQRR